MAKKTVASLQKKGAKAFTKAVKMIKNEKKVLILLKQRLFLKIK